MLNIVVRLGFLSVLLGSLFIYSSKHINEEMLKTILLNKCILSHELVNPHGSEI